MFVAHDDGPAGCAALHLAAGNAGLYAFGVLPEHRRRGIGRSLAAACMQRAQELGLKHAVAATTPDGYALAQALGVTGSMTLQQFVWMPPVTQDS